MYDDCTLLFTFACLVLLLFIIIALNYYYTVMLLYPVTSGQRGVSTKLPVRDLLNDITHDVSQPLTTHIETNIIQMDILSALINLMGKVRVGPYAKEALVVAISMKDKRVDMYILRHTQLIANIITELSKKFQIAYEQLFYMNFATGSGMGGPSVPPVGGPGGTSGLLSRSTSLSHALTPRQAEQKPSTIDAFIRAIRLCNAVAEASFSPYDTNQETSFLLPASSSHQSGLTTPGFTTNSATAISTPLTPQSPRTPLEKSSKNILSATSKTPILVIDTISSLYTQSDRQHYGQSPMTIALICEYNQKFLNTVVKPAFEASGEKQVLAVNTLLRRLLLQLSTHSLDGK